MKEFEMFNPKDIDEVIKKTQISILSAIQKVVFDLKSDLNSPGLTWEQIDFLIEDFKKKKPEVIFQEHEQ